MRLSPLAALRRDWEHVLSPTHRGGGGTMREDSLNATHTTPNIAHRGHLLHFLKLFEKTTYSKLTSEENVPHHNTFI
jgi:hypothetical protein